MNDSRQHPGTEQEYGAQEIEKPINTLYLYTVVTEWKEEDC